MICDRFIHLHIPRTGGSLMRGVIQECIIEPGILTMLDTRAHMHLAESKKIAPDAKVFAFVRNPFDWYVSNYHRDIDTDVFVGSFKRYFWQRLERGDTLSKVWNVFTDGQEPDRVGRFEDLIFDISRILLEFVPELSLCDILASIKRYGKARESATRIAYQYYYTNEMITEVQEVDAEYKIKYKYTFGPIGANIGEFIFSSNKVD